MAEALALIGRLDEGSDDSTRCPVRQPGRALPEDIDPASRDRLGTFPRPTPHVGLINAAVTIGELLDARDGRVRHGSDPPAPRGRRCPKRGREPAAPLRAAY